MNSNSDWLMVLAGSVATGILVTIALVGCVVLFGAALVEALI